MRYARALLWRGVSWLFATVLFSTSAIAATRTQQISLQRGWNAVFLEVHPEVSGPATLFRSTPIDIVAVHQSANSSAQFMNNPGVDLFKESGWSVWYSESRPDAFLKTLHAIYGQKCYLIHAKSDFTWSVAGEVALQRTSWQPNAFNFVGFSVSEAAPTFNQFFGASKAHQHNKIYRLSNGAWRKVNDPAAETMRAGEAFWIFCNGNSSYEGPLRVDTTSKQGLVLGTGRDILSLRNEATHPITPTVEHIVSSENPVPLSVVIKVIGNADTPDSNASVAKPAGAWTQALPPLEAGGSMGIPFEPRHQDMSAAVHSSLLRITTDLGTELWVPVVSTRKDLKEE